MKGHKDSLADAVIYRQASKTAPTSRTLPVAAEVVVQEAIDHSYLQREKPRLSDLLKEVEQVCRRKGLRVPHYRTVAISAQPLEKVKLATLPDSYSSAQS